MTAGEVTAAMKPRRAGTGQVHLWSGGSAWLGLGVGAAGRHAHHALQVTVALAPGGRCAMAGPEGEWRQYTGALVPARLPHALDGLGGPVAVLLLAPESRLGRQLGARCAGDQVRPLPAGEARRLADALRPLLASTAGTGQVARTCQEALASISGDTAPATPIDPRIARAVAILRDRPSDPPRLAEAAATAGLSADRFSHLFSRQTGVPYRTYALWTRVEAAIARGLDAGSWTRAAHEAGFADAAHLTRTCRRMLGMSPSALVPS